MKKYKSLLFLLFSSVLSIAQIPFNNSAVDSLTGFYFKDVVTVDDKILYVIVESDTIATINVIPTDPTDLATLEYLTNAGYITSESQDLVRTGNTISITGGATIDLSDLQTVDTDDQNGDEVDIINSSTNYSTIGATLANHLTGIDNTIGSLLNGLLLKETWDANNNTPTLTSGVGTVGDFYIVSNSGSTNLDGETNWQLNDKVFFSDANKWEKVENNAAVVSVFGRLGAITAMTGDYSDNQITTTYTPSNYSVSASNVSSHLEGIDNYFTNDFRGATVSLTNSNTSQDLDQASYTTVSNWITEFNDLSATVTGTTITTAITGTWEVCYELNMEKTSGTNNRQSIAGEIFKNGTGTGGENIAYNRNTSSINQFTVGVCRKMKLNLGDNITIRTKREGSTNTTVNHEANNSSYFQMTFERAN